VSFLARIFTENNQVRSSNQWPSLVIQHPILLTAPWCKKSTLRETEFPQDSSRVTYSGRFPGVHARRIREKVRAQSGSRTSSLARTSQGRKKVPRLQGLMKPT